MATESPATTTASDNGNEPHTRSRRRTPLPLAQLLSVGLIQIAEPITGLCIYPFINQFIRDTGVTGGDERRTGYYGGIIESTFFFSESITVVAWGYLSDRYGRRPILLLAPLGLTAAMLMFGLSTTFWPLVIARSMQGVFNGNIGVSRSVIAEVTDSTNRADAFAVIPLVWSVGSTSAHLIGGLLANPSKRWPDGIGRIPLLIKHPYFLPCGAAAAMSFVAFFFAFLFLKESLPSLVAKEKHRQQSKSFVAEHGIPTECSPLLGEIPEAQLASPQTSQPAPTPKFQDAFVRPILTAVMCTGFLAFLDMCHFSLLPLMWSTSIPLGGLGLDPLAIGGALGTFGFCNAIVQINCMGPVLRRFGVARVFRTCFRSLLICFAMYPLMKYFAQRAGRVDGYVIACMVLQLSCHTLIYFAYGAVQVIVVESVPRGGPMGTANGLAQMASSGSRTLAPTLATSLFAISLQRNLAGGNFVYYACIGLTLIGIYATSFLPRDNADGGVGERDDEHTI